jgi:hypothetical protein
MGFTKKVPFLQNLLNAVTADPGQLLHWITSYHIGHNPLLAITRALFQKLAAGYWGCLLRQWLEIRLGRVRSMLMSGGDR